MATESKLLHELTAEESKELKSVLIDIYKDVAGVCLENGLSFMLVGGSALGAVRHKGFIPWDDDLDVAMPRADYIQFIHLLKSGVLSEKYEFTCPQKEMDSKNLFLKIYLKQTVLIELHDTGNPFSKGIFLDIFPLDYVPSNSIARTVKGFLSNVLSYSAGSVFHVQYPSQEWKAFMCATREGKKAYQRRMIWGKLCYAIATHKTWSYWFDSYVSSTRKSRFMTIPSGRKHYGGEMLMSEVFLPPQVAGFEGLEVYVPNQIASYLTNLYGDYMWIPPKEKRERHFVIRLDFSTSS